MALFAGRIGLLAEKMSISETQPTDQAWPSRVAILGVGLLGGSVAKSLRRYSPRLQLVAWARDESKQERLRALGLFDDVRISITDAVQDCDVVVVASPVDRIAELVRQAVAASPANCLVTDVGSTKLGIVEALENDPQSREKFVAAHPIAGSERSGVEHSSSDLFDEKWIVITPGQSTRRSWVEKAAAFWQLTGGKTREMTPKDHDTHLAAISHVPHLVSALIAKVAPPDARPLVGSGWMDITRVAAGDPEMWAAICQENRKAISYELHRVRQEFDHLQKLVDNQQDEALRDWLSDAQQIKKHSP